MSARTVNWVLVSEAMAILRENQALESMLEHSYGDALTWHKNPEWVAWYELSLGLWRRAYDWLETAEVWVPEDIYVAVNEVADWHTYI